jgi:molybdopterin synthase sulfur carrier subunit
MKVSFYATFRPIVGGKVVEFALPENATVQQLVQEIMSRFPDLRQQMLDEAGRLHTHVHIFINGRDVQYLPQALETTVGANDTVDIFPPVAGG